MKLVRERSSIDRLDQATVYQLVDQASVYEKRYECGVCDSDNANQI